MNLQKLLDNWEDEPTLIRRRDLRIDKHEKEEFIMGRPHTNIKRGKPMGTHEVETQGTGPAVGETKQYKHTGPKYSGPNYVQKSVTGPLQDGRYGGKGAK